MEQIAISKFKATCLRLLTDVKNTGKSMIVTRKGEPVAIVSPPPPPPQKESWLGSMKDTIQITGDIMSPVVDENEREVLND
jgi:antitoxin (DNA-binding transcriptional repressor) of toxin-antitoxin stability system